jgi:inhibitor of KinA
LIPEKILPVIHLNEAINIFSLGDSAVTIDLGNSISRELNLRVRGMQEWLAANPFPGLKDLVVAYSSLSLFYDPVVVKNEFPSFDTAFAYIEDKLQQAYQLSADGQNAREGELIRIPACYDDTFAADLDFVSRTSHLSKQEVIELHLSQSYYVYMIGFLPGFSYMAEVDEKIRMPRKINPVPVAPGSIGISDSQTGIYPLSCLGGWQIIGKTPLKLFDEASSEPVKLKPGDQVEFYAISREEFDYGEW